MDHERWQRIEAAFDRIRSADIAERGEVLEEIGREDPELRAEVEKLLAAPDETADGLLSPLPAGLIEEMCHVPDPFLGRRVGRFRVERVIASGGMGTVFEAIQEQPRRSVALKIMRPELATGEALRRFEHEWQTLARLRHENIAQVYDAGIHEDAQGRVPFIAMEYIPDAKDIVTYAEDHRLGIRSRLELVAGLCDAVHHGHQRGVIHRDLKPANVLVDVSGRIKVIDFGIARAADRDHVITTLHTSFGQLLGTMQYMSPEQCDGDPRDVDTRSDVYSLGVIAYELLTGQPPYSTRGLSVYQAMRVIRESIPPPLSSLDRRLRGDTEAIVAKALEKNRDRRYPSAQAMQDDIERYLRGDTVSVQKPSIWRHLTRRIRRHPILTSAIMTAAATLLVSVLIIVAGELAVRRYARLTPVGVQYPFGDRRAAHLVSRFGDHLAIYGSASSPRVNNVMVQLVERPSRFGGGKVVLSIVIEGARATEHQLCMHLAENLETPVWMTPQIDPAGYPEVPDEGLFAQIPPPRFGVEKFLVADVFLDPPGEDEIIVIGNQFAGSPGYVRIYDFGGDILFEAWHLGLIKHVAWWKEVGLVVCAGDRHGRSEISMYGYPEHPPPWPDGIFAIRPQSGVILGWVNEIDWPDAWRRDPLVSDHVAWYKTLAPREIGDAFQFTDLIPTAARVYSDLHLEAYCASKDPVGNMRLDISPQGELLHAHLDDFFIQTRQQKGIGLPDLIDWPPP